MDQRAQPCGGEGGAESHSRPSPRRSLLRTAFLLLLLTSATWLLGLLAVNSDALTFHYLFAVFSCLQVGGRQGERASLGEATVTCAPSRLKCPEGVPGDILDPASRPCPRSQDTRGHSRAVCQGLR